MKRSKWMVRCGGIGDGLEREGGRKVP